jgi:hypothetical protein
VVAWDEIGRRLRHGVIPDSIAGSTKLIGVEFDSLTSRIAQALYPQETILHSGFQRVPMPDGEFTLSMAIRRSVRNRCASNTSPNCTGFRSTINSFSARSMRCALADCISPLYRTT